MITKDSFKQAGSAHIVIIIIIILGIFGGLGFVFWKNSTNKPSAVSTQKEAPSKKEDTPAKKSEIIVQADSDMNKYVNHEQSFEFLFPKAVKTHEKCTTRNTVYGTDGEVPSRTYYTTSTGSMAMTVLEGDGRYVIAPKEIFVLSDIAREDSYDFAGACTKQPATLELLDFENELEGNKRVEAIKREFKIIQANDIEDIKRFAQKNFGDTQATAILDIVKGGRQKVAFALGPDAKVGIGAYSAWYYPTQKKLVYMGMGQNVILASPTSPDLYYEREVVESFRFTN